MQVMFRDKVKKEDITIRNLLRNVLFNSNKDYKTERQLNIPQRCICECCRGKRKTSGSYIWRYAND